MPEINTATSIIAIVIIAVIGVTTIILLWLFRQRKANRARRTRDIEADHRGARNDPHKRHQNRIPSSNAPELAHRIDGSIPKPAPVRQTRDRPSEARVPMQVVGDTSHRQSPSQRATPSPGTTVGLPAHSSKSTNSHNPEAYGGKRKPGFYHDRKETPYMSLPAVQLPPNAVRRQAQRPVPPMSGPPPTKPLPVPPQQGKKTVGKLSVKTSLPAKGSADDPLSPLNSQDLKYSKRRGSFSPVSAA